MPVSGRLITTADLIRYYLGYSNVFGEATELLKGLGAFDTTMSPSFWNRIYGPLVWNYLNMEANVWNLLPKTTWPRSGWRALVGRTVDSPLDIVHNNAGIPSFRRPTFKEIQVDFKYFSLPWEFETGMYILSNQGIDDIAWNVQQVAQWMAIDYAKAINQLLLRRVIGKDQNTSIATDGDAIVPLDRAVSGYDESTINATATVAVGSAVNVYGIDRATAPSIFDAVVDHNNGTLRALTFDIIPGVLSRLKYNAATPSVVVTGPDTEAKLWTLFNNIATAMYPYVVTESYASVTVNGVKTEEGAKYGAKIASLFGLPLVSAVDTPKEPGSTATDNDPASISRIYILDLEDPEGFGFPRTSFSILIPTTYYTLNNPLIAGKPAIQHILMTIGNTTVRRLNSNAKIRDLQ